MNRYLDYYISMVIDMILSIGKAFWFAITQIAWGLAGLFLLGGLLAYYKMDPALIKSFFPFVIFIQRYWGFFFAILFFYDCITSFQELRDAAPLKEKDRFYMFCKKCKRNTWHILRGFGKPGSLTGNARYCCSICEEKESKR